jgi:hypothetical protein
LPTITARTASGTNEAIFILSGYTALRTVIDYPNGLGYFFARALRRFDPGERVAWASADAEGGPPPAAATTPTEGEEEVMFDRAAHRDLHVGVPGA